MRWAYKVVGINMAERQTHALGPLLNAYGEDGWELVGLMEHHAVFKRPRYTEARPAYEEGRASVGEEHSPVPSDHSGCSRDECTIGPTISNGLEPVSTPCHD